MPPTPSPHQPLPTPRSNTSLAITIYGWSINCIGCLIVDRNGTPLAATLTGGNRHDVTQLLPLLDAVPPIGGLRGRPRCRPRRLYADRGYDFDKYRRQLWKRGIKPMIARRGIAHGSGLGKVRWVVERAFAWLHQFSGANGALGASRMR